MTCYKGIRVTTENGDSVLLEEAQANVKYDQATSKVTTIVVERDFNKKPDPVMRGNLNNLLKKGTNYRILSVDPDDAVIFPVFKAKLRGTKTAAKTELKFDTISDQSFSYQPKN